MHNISKALNKYCRTYTEPEVSGLQNFPGDARFRHAIVIPAYRENEDFLLRLQALAERESKILFIVVINQPDTDGDMTCSASLNDIGLHSGAPVWRGEGLTLLNWPNSCRLLLVNRFSEGRRIPVRQGVGLARKVGCDIALELKRRGQLMARFVHNTDADAYLPADYLQQTSELPGEPGAVVYPFRHRITDDALGQATAAYEKSLHYYVKGLKWAGSPYAFHTVGSCLAISLCHYALARGFPKRSGGEDFYLLNKLAKLAPVGETRGDPIELAARRSSRVPFGTGPAVEKILSLTGPEEFKTYNPRLFKELAQLIQAFSTLWQYRGDHESWFAALPNRLQGAGRALGLEDLFTHLANQAEGEDQYRRQIHNWFDAFRTLKLVHHLQSHHHPPVLLKFALEESAKLFTPST